jgi:hypothetical protein
MIVLLAGLAAAAPIDVRVTFDNGGFNLPMYTARWNGRFEQPSVAQQLAADLSRTLGRSPRVFTYLPPGRVAGRSSDPFEVVPRMPGCTEGACPCPVGDRCWEDLDVNLHPAASTSLFQAATAIRARGPADAWIEIHFTDLFEEDPASAANPADADRCVTPASTRKAVEALVKGQENQLDHVAVGRLSAQVVPPMRAAGGATAFVETDDGCWTARRTRTFGGGGPALEFAMGVVILGFGTADDHQAVLDLLGSLQRQVSSPLALDLVVVREPMAHLSVVPMQLSAREPTAALPPLPPRMTPCEEMRGIARLRAADHVIDGELVARCDGAGQVTLDSADLQAAFRATAGLDPRVVGLDVDGTLLLRADTRSVQEAVVGLPARSPVRDRPLVLWGALVDALNERSGLVLPRSARFDLEGIRVTEIDRRPWWWALGSGTVLFGLVALMLHGLLTRFAANRAFRRHLHAGNDAPLAAVLQTAAARSREGWLQRAALSLGVGLVSGALFTFILLRLAEVVRG